MTTKSELLELAKKHEASSAAVRALLLSISEAQMQALQHLSLTESASRTLSNAAKLEEGYNVSLDHSDFVRSAASAASALSRIGYNFINLAVVLSDLGESVEY